MLLKSISLTTFRNYKKAGFNFSSGTTFIIGPNTSGKSNLLEAVFLLASGGSLRAVYGRELIRRGEAFTRVGGEILSGESRSGKSSGVGPQAVKLELIITSNESFPNLSHKRFKVNGVGRNLSGFVGHLLAVSFSPEDLNLVTDSPGLRRRYLNFFLSQAEKGYGKALSQYDKIRRQRSRLLYQIKNRTANSGELPFWDNELCKLGAIVYNLRQNFFLEMNKYLGEGRKGIEPVYLEYCPSVLDFSRLKKWREREIAAGTTLVGPHRDDFSFQKGLENNGSYLDLRRFGSRGEQRLAILALKLAELEYLGKKREERPILLLDDIFSELDGDNRERILELLGHQQTLVTATDLKHLEASAIRGAEVVKLPIIS